MSYLQIEAQDPHTHLLSELRDEEFFYLLCLDIEFGNMASGRLLFWRCLQRTTKKETVDEVQCS